MYTYIKKKLDYLHVIKLSEKVKFLFNTLYNKNKKRENKYQFYSLIVNKLSNIEEEDLKNINNDEVNQIKLEENNIRKLENNEI